MLLMVSLMIFPKTSDLSLAYDSCHGSHYSDFDKISAKFNISCVLTVRFFNNAQDSKRYLDFEIISKALFISLRISKSVLIFKHRNTPITSHLQSL